MRNSEADYKYPPNNRQSFVNIILLKSKGDF